MTSILKALPLVLALATAPLAALPAVAQNKGVIVVANDTPITDYDITQKINLLKVLGSDPSRMSRKEVLQSLVNDVVKLAEARRMRVDPPPGEVDGQVSKIAKNLKMDSDGLYKRLKERGVAQEFFRRYVAAQIGFNRVISVQNKKAKKADVSEADVDRKLAEIKSQFSAQVNKMMADPRMKPINVLSIIQYDLPLENDDPGLLQARAVEAQQVTRQFTGCKNPRAASSGVFNVKVSKTIEADASKVPAQLRQALLKAGVGKAIGPLRGPGSLQVIGYCGSRKIVPPKPKYDMPTRDQVRNALENEQFAAVEEQFLKDARKHVYIEYRDQSFATQ
jgi:peptidyl-prolyl cis-trans isomerase SurA